MRPTEVLDEQIIQAGQALEAASVRVSGFALRKSIGAGTPARLMKVWTQHKEATASPTAAEPATLPIEIEDALKPASEQLAATLRVMVSNLHQVSTRLAEHRVAEVSHKAAQEKEAFEAELEQAGEMLDSVERASVTLREELAQVREAFNNQTAELAQVKERLEHAHAALAEAKEAAKEARQQADAARLEAEQAQHALEAAKQAHAQEQGRSEAALATEQEKLQKAEKLLNQTRITCDALSEQMNDKSAQLASANTQIKGLQERLVDQGQRVEEQRSELNSKRQTIARLERLNDQQAEELKQLREPPAAPEA